MGVARNLQVGGRDAVMLEHVDLFQQDRGVHHAAVADHRDAVGIHDARGNLVQTILLITHHDGVARVVTALIAYDAVEIRRDKVADLALALIAPLGTDQHCRRHDNSSKESNVRRHTPQRSYYRRRGAHHGHHTVFALFARQMPSLLVRMFVELVELRRRRQEHQVHVTNRAGTVLRQDDSRDALGRTVVARRLLL